MFSPFRTIVAARTDDLETEADDLQTRIKVTTIVCFIVPDREISGRFLANEPDLWSET